MMCLRSITSIDRNQPTILLVEDALDLASMILRELHAQRYRGAHVRGAIRRVRSTLPSDRDGARICQVADGALLRTIALDEYIVAARFTTQGLILVTNGLETVFVWNI